jgi:hypothetical protein
MKLLALVAAAVLALPMGVAQAQSFTPAKAKTVKKAPVKKTTSTAKKPVPARTAKAVEAVTPVQTPSQRLTDAERAIAENVHTGRIQCELGANVTVTPDGKNPGFFHITTGKQSYYMHPVESRTGAIRMEDTRAGAMWLQLGNKSMLLNQKLGQRVADECAAPAQVEFAARMKTQPPADLLGTVRN